MATHVTFAQRLLLAAGFAVAISAAPLVSAFAAHTGPVPLAECPTGQTLDALTATCRPESEAPAPVVSPLNPEEANLQPGALTASEPGQVGRLPEVNGIPCNGGNTGLCIGLSENNEALNSSPSNPFGSSN
jgi:hypothetical protein